MITTSTGYCNNCKKQVTTKKTVTNHKLHFILTLCTLGYWLIIWAIIYLINISEKPKCSECNSTIEIKEIKNKEAIVKNKTNSKNKLVIVVASICIILMIIGASSNEPVSVNTNNTSENKKIKNTPLNPIPELMPVDIYLNLTNKGFKKIGPKDISLKEAGHDTIHWNLQLKDGNKLQDVDVFGYTPNNVYKVSALCQNYSSSSFESKCKDFIVYLSSIPYKDADSKQAMEWIKNNLDEEEAEIIISDVKFTLSRTSERMIMLSISHKDYKY